MKCSVCSAEMTPGVIACPCCGFEDQRNGRVVGDMATLTERIEREAAKYRAALLDSAEIGVITYSWRDDNGTLVLENKNRVTVGKASQMTDKPLWLDRKFTRVPDQEHFDVTLFINRGDSERETEVSVRSLPQPELLEAGVSVSPDFRIRLHVRNQSEETASEPISFFG